MDDKTKDLLLSDAIDVAIEANRWNIIYTRIITALVITNGITLALLVYGGLHG